MATRQRDLLFGFTEPYMFDRPLQVGFTVSTPAANYNQARQYALLTGQQLNVSQCIQKFAELHAVERWLHRFAELSVEAIVEARGDHVFL